MVVGGLPDLDRAVAALELLQPGGRGAGEDLGKLSLHLPLEPGLAQLE